MGLPPLSKIPFILRPQAWLHRRHYGEVLSPIRWWGRIPFIFYLVSMFVGWLERKRSPLDPVVRSLVSARIAQMCLCEFCVDITSMKVAERTGSNDKLLAVADWRQSPLFSDEERLALEYAEAASVTPPTVDDALRTRLAAHFDAQALTELTALIGLQNLSARFNSAMDIPAQGLCRIPENVLKEGRCAIVGGCWDCYRCFLWQHMPVTGRKLKMRPKGKPSGLTHGAAIPQLTAISTGLAAR